GEDVHMNIDKSRRHVKSADVHRLQSARRVNPGLDSRDLAASNGDISDRVDLVFGVDDVPATQQQVVFLLGGGTAHKEQESQALRELHGIPQEGFEPKALPAGNSLSPDSQARSIIY